MRFPAKPPEDHEPAENRHERDEKKGHEPDEEREPYRHRPPRDTQQRPADTDGRDGKAQRENDGEESQYHEPDPPPADQRADCEEHDRQDRQTDEHERSYGEGKPG